MPRFRPEQTRAIAAGAAAFVAAGALTGIMLYEHGQQPHPAESKGIHATPTHAASLLGTLSATPEAPAPTLDASPFATTPLWSQDFSKMPDGPLDPTNWNIITGNNNGWGNNELEYYADQPNNVQVKDGTLVLQALQQKYQGFDYTSGRVDTAGKMSFQYGRLRITAKLPEGAGVWPAFWLWPSGSKYSSNNADSGWLANGEIDMMEGSSQDDNTITASAHSVNHYPDHNERTGSYDVSNISDTYHTYGLDWTPQSLIFSVDEHPFYTVNNPGSGPNDWPYDQPYDLRLNLAIGGDMSSNLAQRYADGVDAQRLPAAVAISSITYQPLAASTTGPAGQ
jgi:beta-glucanase (GH16 family)